MSKIRKIEPQKPQGKSGNSGGQGGKVVEEHSGQSLVMEKCNRFNECSAPLCPLDPDIKDRLWFHDEEVCKSREHNKHRWIKKQRSIVRRQTKSWLDKPVTYKQLYAASRPKQLSDEQRAKMAIRMKQISKARKIKAEGVVSEELKQIINTEISTDHIEAVL